jgi:hypothetical protein
LAAEAVQPVATQLSMVALAVEVSQTRYQASNLNKVMQEEQEGFLTVIGIHQAAVAALEESVKTTQVHLAGRVAPVQFG